ncbi:Otoferlin [Taenia crassiceps]|uniref:Otoferlin n=1 Tax=Taenia crassiceps TaxID=6207 RepID=A0ABR4QDT1_9CEST
MSLQLDVKLLEGLGGKGQRVVKAKFRDSELSTRPADGQNACYFGAELIWRVARRLEDNDELEITAYDVSKYRPKKVIGSVTVNLATLAQRQVLNLEEQLVDASKMVTNVTLSFDLYYRPPDQGEAELDIDRFGHPLADLHQVKSADDLGEGDVDFGEDAMGRDEKDLMELYGLGDGAAMDIEGLSEKSSVLSGPVRRDPKLKALIDPTILKSETFTISVTIVEAKGLPGVNVNPMVEVVAAGKTRKTDVKFYTNNPYYNKFFSFEYFLPRVAVLDELIWIRVYSLNAKMIARLLPGKLIGEFVIDVRSIYESKGHILTNKWAVLIDPKKPLAGPQGYVRVDLAFLGKDDIPKHIKHEKHDEEISLEGNQLVPKGITNLSKRNVTEFSVKIYRAEGLPPMNTDIITSIKQAFVGDSAPMCDPYVEVSFGGHTAKTKVKKYTYTPIWNQEIVFCDFFPPLTHTIRLAVRDWEAVKDETIATHLIDLKKILDKSSENVMPTFGPSWVNLYGSQRTYTYEQARRPDDELNRSLGEGVAYRGRLLIAIKAQPSKDAMKTGAILRATPPVSELVAGRKSPYLLFVAFYGVSVVDPEIGGEKMPIQFEVSIGNYGNKIDGKKGGILMKDEAPSKSEARAKVQWDHSLTDPMNLKSDDGLYYYVDFGGVQPCLYLLSEFEDHRLRMCIPNIIEKVKTEFAYAVDQIHYLLQRRKPGSARHRLRQILLYKSRIFRKAASEVRSCRGTAPKTMLDLSYQRRVRADLLRIEILLRRLGRKLTGANLYEAIREANAVILRLGDLMDCPQHGLPDVFVSMILDNKRIGFVRIPSRDIYYSASDTERGKLASQVTTHFVRKPGHEGVGEKGWRIQCQLRMYTWLGLVKDYLAYKRGLPEGYDPECVAGIDPPKSLVYVDSSKFELRCYLYLAKNLLASNKTGFSDPMARVLINNEMLETFPIYDTMSPLWDLTLIKTNITFYHKPEGVLAHPPQIIVEFFDVTAPKSKKAEPTKATNFLGRCFCEPNILIKGDDYKPPPLQWWQIYRGQTTAGKLLASFDLIEVDALDDIDAVPTVEDLADFTRRFNERVLLGPSCGIPFSDDSDDYEEYGDLWDEEMQQAARLLDEDAMAELDAPIEETDDSHSVLSAGTSGSLATTVTTTRRKKKKAKVGLATADLVRWRADDALRLPENVRPPLGRYRLEVVFWGVRELRRQFLLPVNRPVITIEVGGTKVVSDLLRSAKINPLFEKRLKYVDLYLPLDEKLWPPITVMCHDHRMFGVNITVGLCTLPNPTDFFEKKDLVVYDEYEESSTPMESEAHTEGKTQMLSKALAGLGDPDEEAMRPMEDAKLQAGRYGAPQQPTQGSSGSGNADDEDDEDEDEYSRKESVVESKPSTATTLTIGTHPGMYTERDPILKDVPKKASSTHGSYDGRLRKAGPQAGLKTFPVNPMTKLSKQQLNTLDWWSRLFASLNDIDIGDDSIADDDLEEADSRFDDNLEKVELLPEDADMEEEVVAEIPDEVVVQGGRKSRRERIRRFFRLKPKKELTALEKFEKQKEKERKKKAKKNRKGKVEPKLLLKIRGDAKKAFLKELQDDVIIASAGIDTSLIERIKIYSSELEEVPDFQGFCSPIRNFQLFRGKQEDDDMTAEERAVGYFKGNLKLYPIPEDADAPESVEELHSFPTLPQKTHWRVLVRCYIIRAFNLHPADPTGLADPYLIVSMGKQVFNEKSNYIPKTLRPTFGKLFQFEVEFPTTTILHIEVMDHDILGSDDMIGQTTIDLESRFYSPYRATCGLAQTYYSHSYAQWRDNKLPTEILADLCQKTGLPPPVYTQIDNTVKVGGKEFYADTTIVDETESTKKSNEPLALAALNHWDEVPGGNVLVPEHVEVRRLLHPEKGSLEQGRLMMWVDMFDRDEDKPPPPIDVTPRTPEPWELRCIIYNTAEVVLNDTSLFSNEKSADIYVRGWMLGVGEDDQKTDVHYRSLSGEGNFNWRFVFPFKYMRYEDRLVFAQKKAFDIDPVEVKMPCDLTLQVWDNELVRSDKFLGSIALRLSRMPRPAKTPATCGLHQLEESCPTLSLFDNKQIRGWWPLVIHDEEEGVDIVQGKVEVELHLVSGQDAEASPVGKGHDEPEALPQPDRPDSSFMSFFGPLNTIRYLIKYKLKWILIKILIAFLLLLIVFLLIYTSPGWISKKIWNA